MEPAGPVRRTLAAGDDVVDEFAAVGGLAQFGLGADVSKDGDARERARGRRAEGARRRRRGGRSRRAGDGAEEG